MTCERCYQPLAEGEHGLYKCPLERRRDIIARAGFEPRFLESLGEHCAGWGDVKKAMRAKNLDFRERPPKGWFSERRDRIEQRKREARG